MMVEVLPRWVLRRKIKVLVDEKASRKHSQIERPDREGQMKKNSLNA